MHTACCTFCIFIPLLTDCWVNPPLPSNMPRKHHSPSTALQRKNEKTGGVVLNLSIQMTSMFQSNTHRNCGMYISSERSITLQPSEIMLLTLELSLSRPSCLLYLYSSGGLSRNCRFWRFISYIWGCSVLKSCNFVISRNCQVLSCAFDLIYIQYFLLNFQFHYFFFP